MRTSKSSPTGAPKNQLSKRSSLNKYYRADIRNSSSPFTKKAPPKRTGKKVLFGVLDIVVLLALFAGVGYSLMLKPSAKVVASNYLFRPAADYEAALDQQLAKLQNRNKITFNEQSVAEALQKQFPEITGAEAELPFFSEHPTFRLSIAKPVFALNSNGTSYVVASSGVAVAPVSQLPRINNLLTVNDQSGFQVKPGSLVLNDTSAAFIADLIAQCQAAKVPIASLTLPPLPQELQLRTKDQSYFVKFYLGGDVLGESGQFLAARKHFAETKQPPSQYLDVRVAGKIFYK